MHLARRQARRIANRTTQLLGRTAAEEIGLRFICEYPKSGGSWLGRMVADALQLPYPAPSVLPVTFPAVVHNHWGHTPGLRNVIYLTRDGRDVMVSYFFHRMRRLKRGDPASVALFEKRYDRLFGKGYDPDDCAGLLPRFIEEEFRRPRGSRIDWRRHVMDWHEDGRRDGVTYVTYEELRTNCEAALARVLEDATGTAPDPWLVQVTVEKHSMERQTGRRAGVEDRSSFVRKGVVGDWRNHFTREAAEVFDALAGDALVALGYESDRAWPSRIAPAAGGGEPATGGTAEARSTSRNRTTSGGAPDVARRSRPRIANIFTRPALVRAARRESA